MVDHLQFEHFDQVLKNDALFLQSGVIQQLADVRPLLDKPLRSLFDHVTRSFLPLQFSSLPPQLISLLLSLDKFLLNQFCRFGPHPGDGLCQIIDLGLNGAEALAHEP